MLSTSLESSSVSGCQDVTAEIAQHGLRESGGDTKFEFFRSATLIKEHAMQLAHIVFFTLADASPAKIDSLVAACHKYLADHPGVLHFSVGTLNPDLSRPVNDREYHVSINVIFDSRDAHDAYQIAARHVQFIEEQKSNWAKVRVFDTDLHPAPAN